MGQGTLTIYSASAGSGKTYKLTDIYLASLFKSRYNYRKILAVTFTNKATSEMKSRILDNLYKIGAGEESSYFPALIKSTGKTEDWVRNEAKEILNSILHDYSRFSISTIDSFFQKVLRSFAREAGIHSGFSIELDHDIILSTAVDRMIDSAAEDNKLKDWLITYAKSNLDEEKSWNLKEGIITLAEELFKENYKILSYDEQTKLQDKKFLIRYIENLKSLSKSFEKKLVDLGKGAEKIYSDYELSEEMFYRRGQGVPCFIRSLVAGSVKGPNSWVREIDNENPKWSTGVIAQQLQRARANGLENILLEAIHYYDENIIVYNSAESVLRNIYALGILSDVLLNVHQITTDENKFLLSDAGELLYFITREDQTPFIYEKVGNKFENYMIDEFQDTSIIQWNNFNPLIENSMAEGSDNLVVGDVKQSIYRWRNSDWTILGRHLQETVDGKRVLSEPLTTNWRSRSNIIRFNNSLFTIIPDQLDKSLVGELLPVSFKKIYSEAIQSDPCKNEGGYVRLEFVSDSPERKCQYTVLDRLPSIIKSLQDRGYKASDIGVIVRDGKEGALVLNTLIDYSNNCPSDIKNKYNFSAVSNDSLLLSNSPAVIFIISVLSVVNEPLDYISRAVMLRYYLMSAGDSEAENVSLQSDKLIEISRAYLPDGYEEFLDKLRQISLFEATESIIDFFSLGNSAWNVPFLNTFQDYVVSFTNNKNADIQSFMEWWEESGKKKSVVLPGNLDAIRILTIHKSKGLEFKAVILPFLTWNLDHISSKQPVLWVKPETTPFNELGLVPVKYNKDLINTVFANNYKTEKYSVYLDNINLLYVALTRARDVLYAFSADNPTSQNTVARLLKDAMDLMNEVREGQELSLSGHYNSETKIFEYGEIPENKPYQGDRRNLISSGYFVSRSVETLKLKLHGENYFSSESQAKRKQINYGKLMHEVFEGINIPADIAPAVRKLVLEGKLAEEESNIIEKRVSDAISDPLVADWFMPENKVLTEAGIILPSSGIRRPDRVIFKNGKTTIIDFKFGEENPHYADQVNQYRNLLIDMGYKNIEAFIWYFEKNKIITA
jgi:ATP-dependent helicase/nuclease subunit A